MSAPPPDLPSLLATLRAAGLHASADALVREADERGLVQAWRDASPRAAPRSPTAAPPPGAWTGDVGGPVVPTRR